MRKILLGSTFWLALSSFGAAPRPYVLSYDGRIDLSLPELTDAFGKVFEDADPRKVIRERMVRNVTGTDVYRLEAFIEPVNEKDEDYFQRYVTTHAVIHVGKEDLVLRPARHLVALSTLNGLGPDEQGKEISWGAFTRLRRFPNVHRYNDSAFDVATTLGQGRKEAIEKLLPGLLGPSDAILFLQRLELGIGPAHHKLSRIQWHSTSFFEMEDGSYVERAVEYHVDRKLVP